MALRQVVMGAKRWLKEEDFAVCVIVGIFVSYVPPSADGVFPKLGSLVVLLVTRRVVRLSAT